MATIQKLKELINETHKHGVELAAEIHALEAKGRHGLTVQAKRALLKGLEVLNARRRKELAKLESEQPKPTPKPAPVPPKPTPKPAPTPKPSPPPPRFTMYDSTNVDNIPEYAVAIASYVNGAFENFDEAVHRFPHAKHLSIAVSSDVDADCLDVETGDATPADAPTWVRKQH